MMDSPSSPRSPLARTKRTLASILRQQRTLEVSDAVDVALDVCDALASAHFNGLVHGDLGPLCVRVAWPLDGAPQPVEIFSLARDDSTANDAAAVQFAALLAPEQRDVRASMTPRSAPPPPASSIDARVDIWAVGVLLHRMLGGVVVGGRPSTLVRVPKALTQTIDACLAADPADRPQTVDELSERIASFASSPALRFERLAHRRAVSARMRVARELRRTRDTSHVLDRLDELALDRAKQEEPSLRSEIVLAPIPVELEPEPVVGVAAAISQVADDEGYEDVHESELEAPRELPDDEGDDLETRWEGSEPLTLPLEPRVAALAVAPPAPLPERTPVLRSSIAPVVLADEVAPERHEVTRVGVHRAARRARAAAVKTAAIVLGVGLACVALATGGGLLVTRAATKSARAPEQALPAAPPRLDPAGHRAPAAQPVATATATASAALPAEPAALTPAALPDAPERGTARPRTAASAAPSDAVRVTTPDALPDAKR